VSQLIHAVDWDGIIDSINKEALNWTFLNKNVSLAGPSHAPNMTRPGLWPKSTRARSSLKVIVVSPTRGTSLIINPPATLYQTQGSSKTSYRWKDTCSSLHKLAPLPPIGWPTCLAIIAQSSFILTGLPISFHW
jgi:hypothetical protein